MRMLLVLVLLTVSTVGCYKEALVADFDRRYEARKPRPDGLVAVIEETQAGHRGDWDQLLNSAVATEVAATREEVSRGLRISVLRSGLERLERLGDGPALVPLKRDLRRKIAELEGKPDPVVGEVLTVLDGRVGALERRPDASVVVSVDPAGNTSMFRRGQPDLWVAVVASKTDCLLVLYRGLRGNRRASVEGPHLDVKKVVSAGCWRAVWGGRWEQVDCPASPQLAIGSW